MSKPSGRFFFQILWPSQKTSTLEKALGHMINNCDDEKMMQNAKCFIISEAEGVGNLQQHQLLD